MIKRYRLTFFFMGTALVISTIVALAVNAYLGKSTTDDLVALAEEDAIHDAAHIQSMIRLGLMGGPQWTEGLPESGNAVGGSATPKMDQPMPLTLGSLVGPGGLPDRYRMLVEGSNIVKLNLYDLNGLIVWSSDSASIGASNHNSWLFKESLSGSVRSKFERGEEVVDLDGVRREIDILETYMPLRDSSGQIIGVIEIYGDVTHDAEFLIDQTRSAVLPRMLATMGAVFLVLSGFIIVADVSIQRSARREISVVENQLAERKLAEAEIGMLSRFPEENPNPVMRITRDGVVQYANSQSGLLLNRFGCDVGGVVPEFCLRWIDDSLASKSVKEVELDSGGRVFGCTLAPVETSGYVNLYGHDITERRQAEREVASSHERYAGILAIADDAIVSIDESQHITMFNKGAERIFGYAAEEAIGQPLDTLIPEVSIKEHRSHVVEFGESPESSRGMGQRPTIFGRRKDGTKFHAEGSISKLDVGEETIYTAMLRDVTARELVAQALEKSNDELEKTLTELRETQDQLIRQERLRALGTMASGVAHDFNNALVVQHPSIEGF